MIEPYRFFALCSILYRVQCWWQASNHICLCFENQVVYGDFTVGMVSAAFHGTTFFKRLHDFQGNLDLFIPEDQLLEDKIKPLDTKVDARTLQLYLRRRHLKYPAA